MIAVPVRFVKCFPAAFFIHFFLYNIQFSVYTGLLMHSRVICSASAASCSAKRGITNGKEIESFFRPDRLRSGRGRQRRRRRESMAVPVSGRQGRRRTVPPRLSRARADVWLYASDLRYRHRPQDAEKRHRRVCRDAPEVEVPRYPDLPRPRSHHDVLRRHRRLDHKIRRGLSDRAGRSRRTGQLLYGLHHLPRRACHFCAFIYGRDGPHCL